MINCWAGHVEEARSDYLPETDVYVHGKSERLARDLGQQHGFLLAKHGFYVRSPQTRPPKQKT